MSNPKVIFEIKKDKNSDDLLKEFNINKKLKVRIIKYGNRNYIDVRKYFGSYPSKKGIRLSIRNYLDIMNNKEIIDYLSHLENE